MNISNLYEILAKTSAEEGVIPTVRQRGRFDQEIGNLAKQRLKGFSSKQIQTSGAPRFLAVLNSSPQVAQTKTPFVRPVGGSFFCGAAVASSWDDDLYVNQPSANDLTQHATAVALGVVEAFSDLVVTPIKTLGKTLHTAGLLSGKDGAAAGLLSDYVVLAHVVPEEVREAKVQVRASAQSVADAAESVVSFVHDATVLAVEPSEGTVSYICADYAMRARGARIEAFAEEVARSWEGLPGPEKTRLVTRLSLDVLGLALPFVFKGGPKGVPLPPSVTPITKAQHPSVRSVVRAAMNSAAVTGENIDVTSALSLVPKLYEGSQSSDVLAVSCLVEERFGPGPFVIEGPNAKAPFIANGGSDLYAIRDPSNQICGVVKGFAFTRAPQRGFVPDIVSHEFLRNLHLTHSIAPKILAVGLYDSARSGQVGLVLYPFMEGKTPLSLLANGSQKFRAEDLGRAFGELNSVVGGKVSPEFLHSRIRYLESIQYMVDERLKAAGLPTLNFPSHRVTQISADVLRNPGPGGLLHGDPHYDTVLLSNKNVIFLHPALVESITRIGVPRGLAGMDRHGMLMTLRTAMEHHNYTTQAMNRVLQRFNVGYHEQLPNQIVTRASDRFAEIYHSVWGIYLATESGARKDVLERLTLHVNKRFGNPVPKKVSAKPVDAHSPELYLPGRVQRQEAVQSTISKMLLDVLSKNRVCTPAQKEVIIEMYGLRDGVLKETAQVAEVLKVSRAFVNTSYKNALLRLRHQQSHELKKILEILDDLKNM